MSFFPNQSRSRLSDNRRGIDYRTSVQQALFDVRTNRIQPFTEGGEITVANGVNSAQALESSNVGDPVVVKGPAPSANQILISTSSNNATWQDASAPGAAPNGATYIVGLPEPSLPNSLVLDADNGLQLVSSVNTVTISQVDSGATPGTYLAPDLTVNDAGFITAVANPYTNGPTPFVATFNNLNGFVAPIVDSGSQVFMGKNNRTYLLRIQAVTDTAGNLPPDFVSFNIDSIDVNLPGGVTAMDFGVVGSASSGAASDTNERSVSVEVIPPNVRIQLPVGDITGSTTYDISATLSLPLASP